MCVFTHSAHIALANLSAALLCSTQTNNRANSFGAKTLRRAAPLAGLQGAGLMASIIKCVCARKIAARNWLHISII